MNKALILTHPFERYQADEQEIEKYLDQEANQYDSVFYIGQSKGRTPEPVNISNVDYEVNKQSRLPPGFEDGHYERGLEEEQWGTLTLEEIGHLLENFDRIEVGGAHKEHCVTNTLNSLVRERQKFHRYSPVEIELNDEVAYGGRTR